MFYLFEFFEFDIFGYFIAFINYLFIILLCKLDFYDNSADVLVIVLSFERSKSILIWSLPDFT